MMYDYRQAVVDDVRNFVAENVDLSEWKGNAEGLEEYLNSQCFMDDAVTGNLSGSYTCSAWDAEEYLAHNLDLLADALNELGEADSDALRSAEYCDVLIRILLLPDAVHDVVADLESALEADDAATEERKTA